MITVTEMARPKSEDPTVAVMFRMKKSAHDWWQKKADERNVTVAKEVQRATESAADRAKSK